MSAPSDKLTVTFTRDALERLIQVLNRSGGPTIINWVFEEDDKGNATLIATYPRGKLTYL